MKEVGLTKIILQKYEIIGKLGQGTEGKVYLVKDLHLDRLAAMKEILGETVGKTAAGEPEIVGEAKLLKELTHPGLPAIYDFFQEEGKTYLVMEYVDGITLRTYLNKNKNVPLQQAVQWAISLCDVLAYLHGRGQAVIYRDLKPENIMVRPDGSLKLIDLGGAMRYACGSSREDNLAGTPGYCPPEQWKEKKGDKTWDVYALSSVLHELLTGVYPGRQPFIRLPLRQYDRSIPKELEKVVKKGTSEKKSERYQTMEQLKEALLSFDRTGRCKRMFWLAKKFLVVLLFSAAALTFLVPLYKGVAESEIPFPFMKPPLLLASLAIIFKRVWFGRRNMQNSLRKQEKNVWLTEKKFSGLYIILFFLLGSSLGMVYAGENEEKLWVEMRDDQGRKMLLKDGSVYVPEECVRFEIPAERLPAEEVRLQIVAEGKKGGVYVSRVFLIEGKGNQHE